MKQTILKNWTFMRFLRLGLGLAVLIQAIIAKDVLFALFGLAFMAMPVFNVGCCATGGCTAPVKRDSKNSKDITYEEVV